MDPRKWRPSPSEQMPVMIGASNWMASNCMNLIVKAGVQSSVSIDCGAYRFKNKLKLLNASSVNGIFLQFMKDAAFCNS